VIVGGILTPLENVMTDVLTWLHSSVGLTWAWSIVALTVIVRVLLVPVAIKQIHSMQSLQIHAPEMKAIQQRYKSDRQKQSEELMKFYKENKINPYASCLPIVFQIPIFISLFFVLKDFENEIFPKYPESSLDWLGLVNITQDVADGWGPVLIAVYVASQLLSTYLMSTSMQSKAQRYMIMVLPIVFLPFILRFPSGLMIYWLTTNLWTTGQGLITRRQMPRPAVPPKRSSRTPPKEEPPASSNGETAPSDGPPKATAGVAPRRVKRKRETLTASATVTVEATGETVGEAKWAALRELEQRVPGLDRESVQFQVVSEGERGLLGVGFTPAHVIASIASAAAATADDAEPDDAEPDDATRAAREIVERIAAGIGADVTIATRTHESGVTVTCSGADVALFIGKHGQTIDAVQYLANAITRAAGGDHEVLVDAAGYRARRTATLENLARRTAQRASATGRRVAMEPMTPVERKIVHEALKDDPEVETASEGSEPNRFVVVVPRVLAG
jgi:YidC/Oxa1 family membrane protein insertase